MSDKITDHISASYFQRFGYKIIFKNETSQTYFWKHQDISITQLKDNGMEVEMPVNLCQKGHTLTLYIFDSFYTFDQKKAQLLQSLKEAKHEIIAKVESLDNLTGPDNACNVALTFIQYDVKAWREVIQIHEDKQEHINDLISKQYKSPKDE